MAFRQRLYATLGSTQESARSHLIGGMVRPGGDVLSLRAYVQLPQHVSDELLHVLMATVVEGDAVPCPSGSGVAVTILSALMTMG